MWLIPLANLLGRACAVIEAGPDRVTGGFEATVEVASDNHAALACAAFIDQLFQDARLIKEGRAAVVCGPLAEVQSACSGTRGNVCMVECDRRYVDQLNGRRP